MTTLTTEQVEEILAGCEYVTPGPWKAAAITQGTGDYCIHAQGIPWQLAYLAENSQVEWPVEANAAHIARLDPQTVSSLATELLALRKRVGELEGALTPGAETKAAYIGEFTIAVARIVNDDEEPVDDGADAPDPYDHIQVPWTTIKQIMAAIRAFALPTPKESS